MDLSLLVCMPLEGYDVRKRIVRQKNMEPVPQLPTRKILWRAAVIIPLLSLLVIVPLKTDIFKSKAENSTMNPLVTAEFENNKKAVDEDNTSEPPKIEITTTEVPAEATPTTEIEKPAPEIVASAVSVTNSYFIITGSFKSRDNAVSQADRLKGMKDSLLKLLPPNNGFFRVCALISCRILNQL